MSGKSTHSGVREMCRGGCRYAALSFKVVDTCIVRDCVTNRFREQIDGIGPLFQSSFRERFPLFQSDRSDVTGSSGFS
jgi:hypothetical protein